jgi:hypothetical protein
MAQIKWPMEDTDHHNENVKRLKEMAKNTKIEEK